MLLLLVKDARLQDQGSRGREAAGIVAEGSSSRVRTEGRALLSLGLLSLEFGDQLVAQEVFAWFPGVAGVRVPEPLEVVLHQTGPRDALLQDPLHEEALLRRTEQRVLGRSSSSSC